MKEKFYQSVINNATFGYACHEIIFDKNGRPADYRIIDANTSFKNILGNDMVRLSDRLVSGIISMNEVDAGSLSTLYDSYAEFKDGEITEYHSGALKKWFNVDIFREKNGFLVTLFSDITYLKSLQNELENTGYLLIENERLSEMTRSIAQSESSYKSLFDHTIDAIYVLDEQGVFIDVNPAAMRMYGYERDEIVGYTPEKLSAPGRNDLEKTKEQILMAFKGEPKRFEWWGIRKNGEVFPKDVVLHKGVYSGREIVFAMARDMSERLHVLEALRESEDKFRTLAEQLPVGIYRTTIDGRIVYTNIGLIKMLGYESVDEFLDLNVTQLYAFPSMRRKHLKNIEKKSGVGQSEIQLIKKNGDLIWVRDNSRLIFDKDGNPVYFDGILEDITDERNNEITVKENEANLKAIIENTLENIWSVNLNYEIQYVNEVFVTAFRNTFGKQLAPGVNIVESLPDQLSNLWKERYDRAFLNEHFLFEDKIDTDHTSIYIEVSMIPIVIDEKVVGVSVYGKDVTEKKLAQIQLQYQSDLRKLLVELSSSFINLPLMEINPALNQSLSRIGEFVGADRAYVFDYDLEKREASNTFEWCRAGIKAQIDNLQNVSLEDYPEIVAIHLRGEIVKVDNFKDLPDTSLRRLLEEQDVISMLTIPLIKDGLCIGFVGFDSVRAMHRFNDYEQQLLQVYAQTLVNVIERLEKEQKLIAAKEKAEESDRLKSAFLANMSHEIRTPMSGIIGFLNLLNEPDLSDENKSAYINIVTQSGLRLLDTINDIIEISKIESGGLQVNLSQVNLSELLGYYDGFFRHQTIQKGLDYIIANNLPVNTRYINTDRKKLDSIISNLLKNAIKFTPSGKIEFGCQLENENIVFFVKDTGIGIPKERMNFIFDRFVQGDLSTSRPHEGSGLGLAIVKAYIGMLNGNISVQSQMGKGTVFSFSIPFLPVEENEVKSEIQNRDVRPVLYNSRILIAEDDYASYLYILKTLSGEGITFIRTSDGEETVKAVKENTDISVILMDIKMPGINGLEATRRIREFNKTVPIIAQTAYSLSGDREMAIEAGCNDYISKPINRKELQNLILKYTGRTSDRSPA